MKACLRVVRICGWTYHLTSGLRNYRTMPSLGTGYAPSSRTGKNSCFRMSYILHAQVPEISGSDFENIYLIVLQEKQSTFCCRNYY